MTDFTQDEIERFKRRLVAEQQTGTTEMLTHRPVPVQTAKNGAPTARMYDPRTGTIGGEINPVLRALMGAGAGAENVITNIGEMTGIIPTETALERLERNKPFTQSPAGAMGEFIGETGALAPVAGPFGRATSTGMKFFGYGGPFTRAAAEGGLSGAITAGPGDRKTGAAFGAGTASMIPVVGGGYRMLTRGVDTTDAAQRLTRRGVTLTPGQADPESNWAMVEEAMMGIAPFASRVSKARAQGWRETQGVIAQEAAPPGFKITPKDNIQEMMVDLESAYNQAYDVAKGFPMLPSIVRTQGENMPLVSILPIPKSAPVKPAARNYANKFLDGEIKILMDKAKKGTLSSDDLLDVRSRIRGKIRELRSAPDADLFEADDLLESAENKITQALESQLPPDVNSALSAIDKKYVNKKVVENAVYRAINRTEGFTPEQFALEVRKGAQSKGQYARGGGPMRDISMEASETFPTRQPMTGRQTPSQIAGYIAGGLTYPLYGESRGSKLARQLLTGSRKEQQKIRDFEEKFRRKLSPKEREAMIVALRTGAGVYGEEERPTPFATTSPF